MNSKRKYVLVADLFNFSKKEIEENNLISVFPQNEQDGAYRFTYKELNDRSIYQSLLFNNLTNDVEPFFKNLPGNSKFDNKILLYPFITITFSLLLDRFIRVNKRIKSYKGNIEILEFDNLVNIDDLGDIASLSSRDFFLNQMIVNEILACKGIKKTKKKIRYKKISGYKKIKNYNFHENFSKFTFKNFLNKIHILFDNIFPSNSPFLCTSLSYDHFYLRSAGVYGKSGFLTYFDSHLKNNTKTIAKNIKLREEIKKEIKEISLKHFLIFFKNHKTNLTKKDVINFTNIWLKLFLLWYPVDFIENSNTIFKNLYSSTLKSCKGILTNEVYSNKLLLVCAFLKKNNKKIIGVQHGAGYYGYIHDWSFVAHFEYYLYDYFLSNGWDEFEKHLPSSNCLPVPSPRLSNLKSIVKGEPFSLKNKFFMNRHPENKRDILFMPSIFHRFPHASTNGHPRIDYIDEINKIQIDLILELKKLFSIDYKPYDYLQLHLQKDLKNKLNHISTKKFKIIDLPTKGINSLITKKYEIILWDTLGSGAIECFVAGIPSLIYWNKLYSMPSTFSKEVINELEESGIIHSNLNSLSLEIIKFKKDPYVWKKNYNDNKFIKKFCDNYAKTDQDWVAKWKLALSVV